MNAQNRKTPSLQEHLSGVFNSGRDRQALALPDGRYSYGELLEGVLRTVGWFRSLGVHPGDRIAVHMVPNVDSVLCYLASLFFGTILVPLNPRYTEEETLYFLEDADVRLFLCRAGGTSSADPACWKVLLRSAGGHLRETEIGESLLAILGDSPPYRTLYDRPPDETALLCYTSGTTGRPKGAMITQGNLASMAASLHEAWAWTKQDILLHALPLFHVHGLLVALQGALYAGARTVLMPGFDPEEILDQLRRERATLFMGVPTMYRRLVSLAPSTTPTLDHVRLFVSGSAPLAPEVFHAFRDLYGFTVLERYGMTEAGMVLSNPVDGDRRPGSVGLPLPGVSVRIVDPETGEVVSPGEAGELLIRSGSVCKGYWRRPEATAEAFTDDGWLRSGDMARQDEDGYFTLVARRKEIVITGGFNVYPKEVENVLERHPAVREAAVFGAADRDLGERVCAAIVPEGAEVPSEEDLIRFCRASLTSYKCPRTIQFMDDLPRNPMGKVVKEKLKAKGERSEVKG
jgi:malonyl-CoA/methylmalonyl-CoA synthetase